MYYLYNENTGECEGKFDSWEEASEASQNFGPEWIVKSGEIL